MSYYELTIWLDSRKKPLCTALFESKAALDAFISSLSSDADIIRIGGAIFRRKDFSYAIIKEKQIRR